MKNITRVSEYELPINIEPQKEGGYVITCPKWTDCYAQGDTIDEAVPILIADMDSGQIIFASSRAERMFDYLLHGELVGKMVEDLVPVELREKHIQHRANYAANPKPRRMRTGMILHGRKRGGELISVEIGLSGVMIVGKKCVVVTIIDVSDQKPSV